MLEKMYCFHFKRFCFVLFSFHTFCCFVLFWINTFFCDCVQNAMSEFITFFNLLNHNFLNTYWRLNSLLAAAADSKETLARHHERRGHSCGDIIFSICKVSNQSTPSLSTQTALSVSPSSPSLAGTHLTRDTCPPPHHKPSHLLALTQTVITNQSNRLMPPARLLNMSGKSCTYHIGIGDRGVPITKIVFMPRSITDVGHLGLQARDGSGSRECICELHRRELHDLAARGS